MTFPTAVSSFNTLTAHVTRAIASDITALQTDIVAIENALTGVAGVSGAKTFVPFYSKRVANTAFGMAMGGSDFAGGPDGATTFDDVFYWGYNVGANGSRITTSLPRLAHSLEASYFASARMGQEWNFDWANTAASGSYSIRPLSFYISQTDSISSATSYLTWLFQIGRDSRSFFNIGTDTNNQIFAVYPSNTVLLGFDGTEGYTVVASQAAGNSIVTHGFNGGVGTAYHVFQHGISTGGVGATGAYDFKAGGSIYITNDVIAGNLKGKATGTGGFIPYDWFNEAVSGTTPSGTGKRVRIILGGTDYYINVYPGYV